MKWLFKTEDTQPQLSKEVAADLKLEPGAESKKTSKIDSNISFQKSSIN